MGKIRITKGRDFEFDLILKDDDGNVIPVPSVTLVRVKMKNADDTDLTLTNPVNAGTDEIQSLVYSAVPDSGNYKLTHNEDTTTAIAFGATNADIQTALRALPELSAVVVTGAAPNFVVTYSGVDGKRAQPVLVVTENTLKIGAVDVTVTSTETTAGVGKNGIETTDATCGKFTVFGSETESSALKTGADQTMDLLVREGTVDIDTPALTDFLDVEDPEI